MARKPPTTVPVPMCSIGVGVYGEFINEADVRSIAVASGVEVKQNCIAAAASSLNDAATEYILISQAMFSEPDGKKADWCLKTADRVASVLACFSHAGGGEDAIESAGIILRGPPEEYIEVERLPINPRDDVRQLALLLDRLLRRATLAGEAYKRQMGRRRIPANHEIIFVHKVVQRYRELTGRAPTLTRGGITVAFIVNVARHLRDRVPDLDQPRLKTLRVGLDRLAKPDTCIDRLRAALRLKPSGR